MEKTIIAIDMGATSIKSIVAQSDHNNKINILGVGIRQAEGINKGAITDINLAAEAINESVKKAKSSYLAKIDETFINIAGSGAKSVRGSGSINVPTGQITEKEIKQVLNVAQYDATVPDEYEAIHVIPLYFIVDNNDTIANPLNMNGSRLEVYVHIVTIKKTALINIKNALQKTGLNNNISFVLKSYSSANGVLTMEQKRLGTLVIDMGGTTCDFVIINNKSVSYNDFIPIGSENITNDLAMILKTSRDVADEIKNNIGTIIPNENDSDEKINTKLMNNEESINTNSVQMIKNIIHARIEESVALIHGKIKEAGVSDKIHNVVLTGGMSKIEGVDAVCKNFFKDIPIKVQNPHTIQNGYMNFDDSIYSSMVGLLMYALDSEPSFELNSKKELRTKLKQEIQIDSFENVNLEKTEEEVIKNNIEKEENIDLGNIKEVPKEENEKNLVLKMKKKLSEWI